jgi:hypothetical protein
MAESPANRTFQLETSALPTIQPKRNQSPCKWPNLQRLESLEMKCLKPALAVGVFAIGSLFSPAQTRKLNDRWTADGGIASGISKPGACARRHVQAIQLRLIGRRSYFFRSRATHLLHAVANRRQCGASNELQFRWRPCQDRSQSSQPSSHLD